VVLPEYSNTKELNPYVFMDRLFQELPEGARVVTGNGSACVMSFQAAVLKKEQRL
jgi:acetolactate synthase-1/2/3 large subunit